ncbi:MAG: DUF3472 domain-containing protein [Ginsengibacter sp.]
MKYWPRITLFLIIFFTKAVAQNENNTGVHAISVFSNGYAYPKKGDETQQFISNNGITGWDDAGVFFRIFFYPQQEGKIELAVKLKLSAGSSTLGFQLDSAGKNYQISIDKSSAYATIPAGSFSIKHARYHYIEIKGISKTGDYFPDIESLIISGPAAKDLKYNLSEYKGAPSTHLWYQYPKDSTVAWFYNEITVPVGVDATNAYYMTNGFSGGYSGIQLNSATERRFIFSIWSNYNTNDPKEIPADYAITLIKKGDNVFTGEFGNEGSGGHSHLVFPWKQGVTYKILTGAKPKGDHTVYSAYYFAPENKEWRLLAIWDKTRTDGKLFSGLYSFVENFGSNGNDFFKADYGNQWICTPSGTWIELTKCSLTTTASASDHQRYDYGAGVEKNQFYMFTGGFKEMNNLAPHSLIERKPNGIAPDIDFSSLPGNK